ncbi:hypothetical protein KAM644c_36860 [Klebsiella quasipneumoniae subsp. quasipneumoniae]|uniref:Uncharacterized protein n=1 Tax=Klebsiella quasipneumoniae subsp. quasipneumoniae TaxID=1667327 RepID=A0AAN1Y7I0_9ENTR|nr:hypothetical protein KAM622c_37950 [Klebsiella quasipneumoniae subsp. quasipneumoniae]BDO14620.1 hypothetical protein KAM644c_36860 [Klebsiella quasipneumoniae subsp. quasipneumoniae]BDO20590.1 hypothetical protein KAM645c_36800 [Klebsiella quasipneumoniae subsp. quasipneumoniae]
MVLQTARACTPLPGTGTRTVPDICCPAARRLRRPGISLQLCDMDGYHARRPGKALPPPGIKAAPRRLFLPGGAALAQAWDITATV